MEINKFIETENYYFINIDFIVAISRNSWGDYKVEMSNGKFYTINSYEEGEQLFAYLKGKKVRTNLDYGNTEN